MTTKPRSPKTKRKGKDDLLHIRVSAEEKQAWERRAEEEGRPLSGWVRYVANRAAVQ